MGDVFEVADGVYQIETDVSRKQNSCSVYFVVDDKTALIETGPASIAPAILESIRTLGYDTQEIAYLIATHIHVDHGGGLGYMTQQILLANVVIHERGVRHVVNPERLIESTREVYGVQFQQKTGPILPVDRYRIIAVHGGETIVLGKRRLQILYTPGHAPHHISLYDSVSKGLFCGEALGSFYGRDNIILPAAPPPSFDLRLAMDSINAMESLHPEVLFYSHYGVTNEVDRCFKSIKQITTECGEYVLDQLRNGKSLQYISEGLKKYFPEKEDRDEYRYPWPGGPTWLLTNGYFMYYKKNGFI